MMRYCPQCGLLLEHTVTIEDRAVKQCTCGYIDWDNWVNVSAVTVAYNDKGEFLMVRMKKTGKLTFPGGYRNIGESVKDAAERECFEESGYNIEQLELFDVYTLDKLRLMWVIYKANVASGMFIDNDEVSEAIFISPDHIPKDEEMRGSLSIRLLHDIIE